MTNPNNPWRLTNEEIAILVCGAHLSWADIQVMPPRVLYNLIDFTLKRGKYAAINKPTTMNTSVSPSEFKAMVEANKRAH